MVERFNAYNRKTNNPEEAKKALYIREMCTLLSLPNGTKEDIGKELKKFFIDARDDLTVAEMHKNLELFHTANVAAIKAWMKPLVDDVRKEVAEGNVAYPFEITPFDLSLTEDEKLDYIEPTFITFHKLFEHLIQPKGLHTERTEIGLKRLIYQMGIAKEMLPFTEMPFVKKVLKALTIKAVDETEKETKDKLFKIIQENTAEYDEYRLAYADYLKENPELKEEQSRLFPIRQNEIKLGDLKHAYIKIK